MKNKIVLFDIDYTLFDVGKFRHIVFQRLQKYFPDVKDFPEVAAQAYEETRELGWFNKDVYVKQLLQHVSTDENPEVLKNVWVDSDIFSEVIYPEVLSVLQEINRKKITMGLFSSGEKAFQKSKIEALSHFFENEHIHIYEMKDEKLPSIVKKYATWKIILVDDYIPVIENVKKANADIVTIWIKRGRLAERVNPSVEYAPDFIIENLTQLLPLIEKEFIE